MPTEREEALIELGESLGSSRRPGRAPAIEDLVAEAYDWIAPASKGLSVAVHEEFESFRQLEIYRELFFKLRTELESQSEAREVTELAVATKGSEFDEFKWDRAVKERELDLEDEVLNAAIACARCCEGQLKQAREKMRSLKEDLNHAHRDMRLVEERMVYLELEVWAEKEEEEGAFERACVSRTETKKLWSKLIEEVGFDYPKDQLLPQIRLKEDHFKYPSQVANCLDALRMLEVQDRLGIMQEDEEVANEGNGEEAISEDADKGLDDDAGPSSSSEKPDSLSSNVVPLDSPPAHAADIAP
ncbi:uncharacterized protein A4U43_C04F33690 [Asparagus officinalis]|uniref:Uncharacterized protein n=1 Tax=Asparagus officinalis TaxID=4686 RepID=A0A5P1F8B7_ASPOF|nr:uncharacterized protein A4U43_C04F33690 [Asparagus officinalis]